MTAGHSASNTTSSSPSLHVAVSSPAGPVPGQRRPRVGRRGEGAASDTKSRASLGAAPSAIRYLEGPVGFEPTTPGLKVRSSNR